MPLVSELFSLRYGHSLELNRLEHEGGADAINFVGRAAKNNGVTARVKLIPGLSPAPAGTISVALGGQGGAGVAFLQPLPYYCGRDVMVLTPLKPMTDETKLWWVTCITANRFRFGFGRQANKTLKNLVLPDSPRPDWVRAAKTQLFNRAALSARKPDVALVPSSRWQQHTLGALFEIKKGRRLTKASMTVGSVPFVGAIDGRNGVSAFVDEAIHDGNTITVSYNGSVGEAFYQPTPFWASDDVNVLYPKFNLTPAIALFVCAVIRLEKYRFNYGRKWGLDLMRETVIRLPSDKHGQPDWDHMGDYILSLPFSSQIDS